MNVTRALGVGLSLWMLSGCGEEKQTPCSGDNCLAVAGTYSVTANSPPEGNTCEKIFYASSGKDGSAFSLSFELTQNGSELTYRLVGSRLGFTVPGTLFDNHSAQVKAHVAHVSVAAEDGSDTWDYSSDSQITFSFTESDGVMHVSGTTTEGLTANEDSPGDAACFLSATFNGHR